MHIVPVKSIEQHSMPCVHRLREGLKADWVACINRIRGLLADWATLSRRINIRHLGPHCKRITRSVQQGRLQRSSLFLVHALLRRLLLLQPLFTAATFDHEYKYSLPRRGSPFKGLGIAAPSPLGDKFVLLVHAGPHLLEARLQDDTG